MPWPVVVDEVASWDPPPASGQWDPLPRWRDDLWVGHHLEWQKLLVGGWTNPSEKDARQNGFIFPKDREENKKYLKAPPRIVLLEACCKRSILISFPKLLLVTSPNDAPGRVKFPCLILRKRFGTSSGFNKLQHNQGEKFRLWNVCPFINFIMNIKSIEGM